MAWNPADTMEATVWFCVIPITIMPQNMKYSSVKYIKKIYQKKFSNCPLEPHHGIHYGSIYAGLNQRVRQLDQNLQYSLQTLTVVTRSSKVTLHFRQDMFSQCIEGDKVCRAT